MENYRLVLEDEDIGERIDSFVSDKIDYISRNLIQKHIKNENILVNGKTIKSSYKLKQDDIVFISLPEEVPIIIKPENIELNILYEDEDIIIINKPKGMVVHPAPGHYTETLLNALLYHCGDTLSDINGEFRAGIVHRLDKDTSGALVVAKNNTSHKFLAQQLVDRTMNRCYNAIVYNNVLDDMGSINKPIARDKKDRKKMAISDDGREAITHYIVKERFGKYTYIETLLETGRTHQIRVHMSSIGNPLVGDTVYGSSKQHFKTNGQVLHSRKLGFIHPNSKKYMEFEASLPEEFNKLLNKLRSM